MLVNRTRGLDHRYQDEDIDERTPLQCWRLLRAPEPSPHQQRLLTSSLHSHKSLGEATGFEGVTQRN